MLATQIHEEIVDMSGKQREQLVEIAAWVAQMCLTFGSSPHTAYTIAGLFVEGLEREWAKLDQPKDGSA